MARKSILGFGEDGDAISELAQVRELGSHQLAEIDYGETLTL